MKHQTYLTKTAGKLRSVFLLLLVTVFMGPLLITVLTSPVERSMRVRTVPVPISLSKCSDPSDLKTLLRPDMFGSLRRRLV